MIETFYNAIRAVSNEDLVVDMVITDADGEDVTTGCVMKFIDSDDVVIDTYDGVYTAGTPHGVWNFTIPAADTLGLCGRFYYRVECEDYAISFNEPLYLI